MKGKTLKQITNTPKAGLKELPALPDNEEFNVEIISKDSGKVYTVSTDAFNSNISTASALFPNGVKIIEDTAYLLSSADAGYDLVAINPNTHFIMPDTCPFSVGDVIGFSGDLDATTFDLSSSVTDIQMFTGQFSETGETVILQCVDVGEGAEMLPLSAIIDDNGTFKTLNKYLYDNQGGGAFIPLSGTEVGKPVTGNIEMNDGTFITTSGGMYVGSDSYFGFAAGDELILLVDNGSPTFRGLKGNADYTANITDLDYPQKKYVDTHIAFTTVPTSSTDTGIKGQMAIDSTYLYVCVDTNTWVRTLLVTW